jgi:hypothetical protein
VIDAGGSPVRGARVRGGTEVDVITNDQGLAELRLPETGTLPVVVSKSGFITRRLIVRSRTAGNQDPQEIRLVRGGVIAGQILDTVGDPATGVRVQVVRAQVSAGRRRLVPTGNTSYTDDTGAFRIYGLPASSYYVIAQGGMAETPAGIPLPNTTLEGALAPTFYPGVFTLAEAQSVTLAAGAEQLGVSFAVGSAHKARVSGTIVTTKGTPPQGGVSLTSTDAIGLSAQTMDSFLFPGGAFEFRDVSPGSYRLAVASRDAQTSATEFASILLDIAGRDIGPLTVLTAPTPKVRIEVRSDSGALVPSAAQLRLFVRDLDLQFSEHEVGPDGTGVFTIGVIPGPATLEVRDLPPGWIVKSLDVGGQEVLGTEVQFGAEDATGLLVLTNRITELVGTVTARGQAIPDVRILIFPADSSKWVMRSRYVATATSDAQGRFTVHGLPADGDYRIVVLDYVDDGDLLDPGFLERLARDANSLSFRDGEKKTIALTCCAAR